MARSGAKVRGTFVIKFVPFSHVCQLELGSDCALPLSLDRLYAISSGGVRWLAAQRATKFPSKATKDKKRRAVRDAES